MKEPNTNYLKSAEILLLLEPNSKLKNLLKATYSDLINNKSLKTTKKSVLDNPDGSYLKLDYIEAGSNLNSNHHDPHELAFLALFKQDKDHIVLLKHLVKSAFKISKNKSDFTSQLIKSKNLRQLAYKNMINAIFGGITLNKEGKKLREQLKAKQQAFEKEHRNRLTNDEPFFENEDYSLAGALYFGFGSNNYKDEFFSEDFNSGFDSGFDSGCSDSSGGGDSDGGDSGCSSCSGCSGCGGCGGCGG